MGQYAVPGAPRKVVRASALQREYRSVLDAAHIGSVQILDRDGTVLGVERWEDMAFAHGIVSALSEVGRFHAVYTRHNNEPASEWASMTAFPFLAGFDGDDLEQFAAELMPSLLAAVRIGSLDAYHGSLRAWESSAELAEDPEWLAAMEIDLSSEELVEVFPPSEEEVAAAGGAPEPAAA